MKRDFVAELKAICKSIDKPIQSGITEKSPIRQFNIHKRSIPPKIDVIVLYNLPSKQRAEYLIENARDNQGNRMFAPKVYQDDSKESKTYIFYDAVPSDATPKERSIFFNEGPLMLGDSNA